ncbi:MAG TPA: hypothetical protein PKD96_01475 [Candidatus Absconditabacterales bacterium]|nr:hypothetical protein [Candidatus Absconditabacterales bacterium]HMT26949.1 hypothetical protein [Candidatus Absconditabacterales bacterium]
MRQKINEEAVELGKFIVSAIIVTIAIYFTFKYLESTPVLLLQIENLLKTQRIFDISLGELRNNLIIITLIIRTTFFVKTRGVQISCMMALVLYGLQKFFFISDRIIISLVGSFFIIALLSYIKNRFTNLITITIITINCIAITAFILPTYTKIVKPDQFYRLQKNFITTYSNLSPEELADSDAQIIITHGEKKQVLQFGQENKGAIEVFSGDKILFASKTGLKETFAQITFQDGSFILLTPQTSVIIGFEIQPEKLKNRTIETTLENGIIIVSTLRSKATPIDTKVSEEKISLQEGRISKKSNTIQYSKNLTGNELSGSIFQNFQSGWSIVTGENKSRDYSSILSIKKSFENSYDTFIKTEYGRFFSDTMTLEDIIVSKMIIGSIYKPEIYISQLKEFQKSKYFLPKIEKDKGREENPVVKLNNYLLKKYNLGGLISSEEEKEREIYKIR